MHKLNRPSEEPEILKEAQKNHSNWDSFSDSPSDKDSIRKPLAKMQNNRCAYCEIMLNYNDVNGRHIEHFRRRHEHPELSFVWSNLFLSCCNKNTCGIYKDRKHTDMDNVIDPCLDNPEYFLHFDIEGRIFCRSGLTTQERQKAENTIDTFNLNEKDLRQQRKNFLKSIFWMRNSSEDIASLLVLLEDQPFITCAYHFLGKQVVSEE